MQFLVGIPGDLQLCLVNSPFKYSFDIFSYLFLGTFTSLYKFLLNALPILVSSINIRRNTESALDDEEFDIEAATSIEVPLEKRKDRLSLSKQAQQLLIRKHTKKWHAAVAGAISGGLAIMCEKRSRRGIISQQMFVR